MTSTTEREKKCIREGERERERERERDVHVHSLGALLTVLWKGTSSILFHELRSTTTRKKHMLAMKCCDKVHESASAEIYTHRVKSSISLMTSMYAPIDDRKSSGTHERLILFTHTSCTRRTQTHAAETRSKSQCLNESRSHEFPTGTSLRIAVSQVPHRQAYTARTRSSTHRRSFIILLEVSSPEIVAFCSRVSP